MKTNVPAAVLLLASTLLLVAALALPSTLHAASTPTVPDRAAPAADPAAATREIGALLAGLRASSCRFERNGRWYDGERAAKHLQRKFDFATARGMSGSAEDFIDGAATRSSFTGREYRVQCGDTAPVPAREWFAAMLKVVRAG
jgi:hypothetical protein